MDNATINESYVKTTSAKRVDVKFMTELALLTAIVILMAFTPLGYLRVGVEEITFIVVPVAVGAVVLGPKAGLFLGAVFGMSSFLQPTALAMCAVIPWQTFITCMVPRLFVGLVPALIYSGLSKLTKKRQLATVISCVAAPLTNTVLYLSFFVIFVGDYMIESYPDLYGALAGKGFWAFFIAMAASVSLNIVLEAASCLVIATAICNALWKTVNKQ